jgi:hypothetical protein
MGDGRPCPPRNVRALQCSSYCPENKIGAGRHGRDNKLFLWDIGPFVTGDHAVGSAPPLTSTETRVPEQTLALDVNALNFCRFTLLPSGKDETGKPCALIAVPNLIDSSLV